MGPLPVVQGIPKLIADLAVVGTPLQWLVIVLSAISAIVAIVPRLAALRRRVLGVMLALLLVGEGILIWFHFRLYQLAPVLDPNTGRVTGHMAISMWVEGERLYVWALMTAILGMLMRKERERLLPGVLLAVAGIATLGVTTGQPFTHPLPDFFSQYSSYIQAMQMGGAAADGAWQGMEASRQFFYDSWFMWVHPPLLYFSYGAFTVSFVSMMQMIIYRHSRFETIAYGWARMGYLPLTAGMLLGFPWAIEAWTGESWWWSGFVNMSIMMWLLYTAYLHARLYLRRRHMWRAVAVLGLLSFGVLVLTYIASYVVPGAHSYAAAWAPDIHVLAKAFIAICRGGVA
jgi:cytochrome c biogenesis factor